MNQCHNGKSGRHLGIGIVAVVGISFLLSQTVWAQRSESSARFPKNAAEFDQMFEDIKNWGRWGPDDQLGTLNLITPKKRKEATEHVTFL